MTEADLTKLATIKRRLRAGLKKAMNTTAAKHDGKQQAKGAVRAYRSALKMMEKL